MSNEIKSDLEKELGEVDSAEVSNVESGKGVDTNKNPQTQSEGEHLVSPMELLAHSTDVPKDPNSNANPQSGDSKIVEIKDVFKNAESKGIFDTMKTGDANPSRIEPPKKVHTRGVAPGQGGVPVPPSDPATALNAGKLFTLPTKAAKDPKAMLEILKQKFPGCDKTPQGLEEAPYASQPQVFIPLPIGFPTPPKNEEIISGHAKEITSIKELKEAFEMTNKPKFFDIIYNAIITKEALTQQNKTTGLGEELNNVIKYSNELAEKINNDIDGVIDEFKYMPLDVKPHESKFEEILTGIESYETRTKQGESFKKGFEILLQNISSNLNEVKKLLNEYKSNLYKGVKIALSNKLKEAPQEAPKVEKKILDKVRGRGEKSKQKLTNLTKIQNKKSEIIEECITNGFEFEIPDDATNTMKKERIPKKEDVKKEIKHYTNDITSLTKGVTDRKDNIINEEYSRINCGLASELSTCRYDFHVKSLRDSFGESIDNIINKTNIYKEKVDIKKLRNTLKYLNKQKKDDLEKITENVINKISKDLEDKITEIIGGCITIEDEYKESFKERIRSIGGVILTYVKTNINYLFGKNNDLITLDVWNVLDEETEGRYTYALKKVNEYLNTLRKKISETKIVMTDAERIAYTKNIKQLGNTSEFILMLNPSYLDKKIFLELLPHLTKNLYHNKKGKELDNDIRKDLEELPGKIGEISSNLKQESKKLSKNKAELFVMYMTPRTLKEDIEHKEKIVASLTENINKYKERVEKEYGQRILDLNILTTLAHQYILSNHIKEHLENEK